ncbi:MAG: tRNA (N(6)-L-threonylcarbamoyladenosine(37)-C(2))-methylthiotransferase MtaB [Dehalococcoidia bacterium]|nr:tRNA (N(6)-L-threonylcarbamoyladenosine(37)-C(2))-methylthiotransferase MtaB [Dehalococcoidia bacterium]
MSKVTLESLGCKLNQAEIEALADRLVGRGHEVVGSAAEADVYVLNTCTVTHIADRKSRQALRAARRSNPQLRVIAIGCYARRAPRDLARLGVVDAIVGHPEDDAVHTAIEGDGRVRTTGRTSDSPRGWSRTRSLVKIQEGCASFCSFCVVPYTRGPGHNRTPDDILAEINDRVARGHKEVVLTGTKLGDYRWNGHGSAGLPELVRRILAETKVERLRLSSLQPADLTPELLDLWHDSRLCPHLHLPLQSGSEVILRRMHRPYTLAEYEGAVRQARQAIPDLSITTDMLVGFPGEADREFEESYRFCESMGFAGIHVFQYSKRPGTPAATMPVQIDDKTRKQRSARMMALGKRSAGRFRSEFLGRTMPVLWEDLGGDGLWSGHTANYLRVYAKSDKRLAGKMLAVRVTGEYADGLGGEMVVGGYDG